ncbi:MAG: tryptophan--tRNA ligase [Clostridia bacterium]|nr:tryptophan--tRNA ligase [Clostridia bacterium]
MNIKKRILTGDRPTGKLHIGHYLGSLQNRVKLQDEYDQYIIIADVQALTDNYNNPEKVRKNVFEVTMDNLACGINPNKSNIFIQSMIPEIAELTVFYSNLVTVARLERNPTVKTEIQQKKELFGEDGGSVTYGFLGYPVSQTADITVFNANLVPVGEDQLPMIEQAREIVRKFNGMYGEILVEPEAMVGKISRVKGLDGNNKMGKSLNNAIYLADDEDQIRAKVRSAITDSSKIKKNDPANPEICMVGYYHEIFNKENKEKVFYECRNGLRGCVDCKNELSKAIIENLKEIREKRKYYEENPKIVEEILMEGTKKARQVAKDTMYKVKESMRINYFNS